MNLNQTLLPEFSHEMSNTRRALERVATETFEYKPHEKSGTMIWLANHIAMMPGWAAMTITTESLNLDGMPPPTLPATTEELLSVFDKNVADGREALNGASNENLTAMWSLQAGGKKVIEMPRIAVIRGMIMNHLIHHRGELVVYLRLNNIPVPALYGPSADEPSFAAGA